MHALIELLHTLNIFKFLLIWHTGFGCNSKLREERQKCPVSKSTPSHYYWRRNFVSHWAFFANEKLGGGGGELPHSGPFAIFWSIPKTGYYNPPPPWSLFLFVYSRFHPDFMALFCTMARLFKPLARRPPTSSAHTRQQSTEVQVHMDLHPRCVDVLLKCWFWILQTLSCLKKIRASNDFRVFGLFWACFYVAVKELFLLSFS